MFIKKIDDKQDIKYNKEKTGNRLIIKKYKKRLIYDN